MDLDDEDTPAIVFVSAADEEKDYGFDSGTVSITFRLVLLYSYILRVVIRRSKLSVGKHLPIPSRPCRMRMKPLRMEIRPPMQL